MGAVAAFDPAAEHARTRAALAAVVPRLADLMRGVPDLEAPSGVPPWSVGDVAAHVGAAYLLYSVLFTGEEFDWAAVLPPGDAPLIERISAVNAVAIGLFGAEERRTMGDFVTERAAAFLDATADLPHDHMVAAPWYGATVEVALSTITGLLVSESLLHGLDIARGARRPWRIGPEEARLAVGQTMPTMMPLALNTEKTRGVSVAIDIALRGGPHIGFVLEDGVATVTRDPAPRSYDCRISATPAAFLLVGFRRTPLWKTIATGRITAVGRKPWIAARLTQLVGSP
ncbi:maleylpyruvate isomerase N-terminal domain-containing protein [Yinghuangia seranimata]|uniref:maleylpyruvate isomerase N-terminal domain-containing protein n=1 Tax=Yinghuangia seranimata TaxID=408067 RepID=UPI00248C0E90|nr:maleylpyruvate isomerase N-terminal domain-containing protein [Yinghuangia seranimata]MDI2129941.1 maleylpyruvate isomerase N-terminal domain-containing protein [Yinghuangia seranimata]